MGDPGDGANAKSSAASDSHSKELWLQEQAVVQSKPYETPSFLHAGGYADYHYQLSTRAEEVAVTGHSTVHKSYSLMFGQFVALKIIDKGSIPNGLADKFLPRELDVTLAAKHPHIVRCLHIAHPNPSKFIIVSEFCEGGTLLKYVQDHGGLDERESARVFRQLVEAVHYLHETLKVAHRDIKLENILLDSFRTVKLADFGFARDCQPAQRSTSYCGTRPYSSPQIVEHCVYEPLAADWFACGICLFTMITNTWPCQPWAKITYPLPYPVDRVSPLARNLIDKLVHRDEASRAGYAECVASEWLSTLTSDGAWLVHPSCGPPTAVTYYFPRQWDMA